jgi:hypothetical protein
MLEQAGNLHPFGGRKDSHSVQSMLPKACREGLSMTQRKPNVLEPGQLRLRALSRWDNEGGAIPRGIEGALILGDASPEVPHLTNAELVQLRIRVIALENVAIAMLAKAPDGQLDLVREMAAYISPRSGFTQHPLTVHAAAEMIHLVERALHFRGVMPS